MIKTFSYRIKDAKTNIILEEMTYSVNVVWNFCNDTQLHALKWNKRWPTGYDLNKLTSGTSKELGLHATTIQAVCQEYELRRKTSKKAKLRWRGKRSLGWIPFKKDCVKIKGSSVRYRKKIFRFWLSRPIEGTIKTGSFNKDARGRWYVNFQCKIENPQSVQKTHAIGIDLGLKDFATLSTGEKIEAPRLYRELEEKLAIAQRAHNKDRIKAIHAQIVNRRKDFLHKLSTRLVNEYGAIFVGNVNASKLAKTRMAKSVLDAGWSAFRTMLRYKAISHGVVFEEVDEAFSTRTCSECGALSGPISIAGLGMREWTCSECGSHHDRDVNSAKYILALGCQRLAGEIPSSLE